MRTETEFAATCNNFWWCLNNVAKGIARDELPYAMTMLNAHVREALDMVVEWYIGSNTNFSVSSGKMGKYFKRYLPEKLYRQYCATYAAAEPDAIWNAVFAMCDLFHGLAVAVANHLGFAYKQHEEDGIREYLAKEKNARYHIG